MDNPADDWDLYLETRERYEPSEGTMESKWKPIETAPHNTEVLLYCPHRGIANEERIELGKATFGEYIPGVKSTRGAHAWATHWMPLPEFPIPEE